MDALIAAEFSVGWAPEEWSALTDHLRHAGFQEREITDAGLAREREQGGLYDLFRARVMFPIHDERGRPVGFGGRTIAPDGIPKYLNSPQSELFDKSRLMYALHRAIPAIREASEAVVVEGYTDVLSAHGAGFRNVVASLGTALTEHHLVTLKRFAPRVVLALDSDAAGRSAMLRGLEVAQGAASDVVPVPTARGLIRYEHRLELDLRVALLPAGQDPDDVIRADPEVWRKAVADAVPVLSYMFDALTTGLALDEPTAKTEAVRRLMPVLAGIPDAVSRSAWVEEYANRLRLDPRALAAQLAALANRRQPARRGPARYPQPVLEGGASPFFQTTSGTDAGLVEPGGLNEPGTGRGQRAEGRLADWILGQLLGAPALLDRLTHELVVLGLTPLSAQDWTQRMDRDLFTALANARRGAPPPDTMPEHRLEMLPLEHDRRRQELTRAIASAPAISDDVALRALLDACLRLRIQRRKLDMRGLRLLMQDVAPAERDDLAGLVRDAGQEVRSLERLLTSVTPVSGKVDQAVTRRYDI
jgi:DNA primase